MLNTFLIGFGNVGRYLSDTLDKKFRILGVYDPFVRPPKNFSIPYFGDINSISTDFFTAADLVIIAVNDDAISSVVENLIASLPSLKMRGIIHTSGNFPATILAPLKAHFAAKIASLHPFMTFTGKKNPQHFYYWGFEGDEHLRNICQRLCKECNSGFFSLNPDEKKRYHIAGVFASNFLISHIRICARLLENALSGKEKERLKVAPQVLLPLIEQTLRNVRETSMGEALSGPMQRNDLSTLRSHMVELEKHSPDLAYLYSFLSIELIDLLEEKNKPVNDDIKRFFEL
jgi:predicted short-subunit dehydrogenase-like oxidoreductase (DUF2520 family)